MGFTTAAFIRRNTPELRKKLDELGYRLFGAELNEDLCIFTEPEYGLYSVEFFSNIPHPDETDSVDCGTNEKLFLAIAALRDDTDDSQWFVYPPENIWFICDDDDINYARENIKDSVQAAWFHCSHKATVEELIEHFKEKEE